MLNGIMEKTGICRNQKINTWHSNKKSKFITLINGTLIIQM